MSANTLKSVLAATLGAFLCAPAQANFINFSLDPDVGVGATQGSQENGTNVSSFVLPMPGVGDQIDAMSGRHGGVGAFGAGAHGVSLENMFTAEHLFVPFSVAGSGDIRELKIGGPDPRVSPPRSSVDIGIHATAADLGLTTEDVDAIEEGPHTADAFGHAYSGIAPEPVYFSVNGGVSDTGDIFHSTTATGTNLYLDDSFIGSALGFNHLVENIDALIVFDVNGDDSTFSGDDTVFFSLEAGAFDSVGDNIYWYSAGSNGSGLWVDPGLTEDLNAMDVHIPLAGTLSFVALGLLGAASRKRRR